jgi:hypothetical protein
MIKQPIPKSADAASLTIKDTVSVRGKEVPLDREFDFNIGHLDPVDLPSGQQARLANLGYYRGPQKVTDPDEFLSVVEEFQCENQLGVDGVCGPPDPSETKSSLRLLTARRRN